MAGSLNGMPSRLAISVCGTISLAVGRVCWEPFTFQSQHGMAVTFKFAGNNNVQEWVLPPFRYLGLQNYVYTG